MQQRSRPLGGCTRAAGVGRGPRAARAWSSAGEPGPGVLLRVNAVCSGGGNFEPVRRQEVCASQRRTMPLMMTQMVGKWCLKCPLWLSPRKYEIWSQPAAPFLVTFLPRGLPLVWKGARHMPRVRKQRSLKPSSAQAAAARSAQAAYSVGLSPTRSPGDDESGSAGEEAPVRQADAAPAPHTSESPPAAETDIKQENVPAPATPAVDNYSRFLAEHARRKAEEVGDPQGAGEAACDDETEGTGDAQPIDAEVAVDAPDVFDSASVREELLRLSDQVSRVLHNSTRKVEAPNDTTAAEWVNFQDAPASPDLFPEQACDAAVGNGVPHPSTEPGETADGSVWTPEKVNVNPQSAATAQKNPTAVRCDLGDTGDAIRNEILSLQAQIVSLANKCARRDAGDPSKNVQDDLLAKVRLDLEQQNQELEAAIQRQAAATQFVDPNDKFFLKLESVLSLPSVLESQNGQDPAEGAVLATVQPDPPSSVQEQLHYEIGQKMALQRKVEQLLSLGTQKKMDTEFLQEAEEKLTQIKAEVELCQTQLAVIGSSCDLLARAPISPASSVKPEARRASPVPTAPRAPNDNDGDTAVVILPLGSAAVRAAAACRREAIMRLSYNGTFFLLMAALVAISATVAPYGIPGAPSLLFFVLGVYQRQYASSVLEEKQGQEEVAGGDEDNEDEGGMPQTPYLLGALSFVLSLLLLISCLAFGYSLYTTMDMVGTPACVADETFQTRFTTLCQDPSSAKGKRASPGTQAIKNTTAVSVSALSNASPDKDDDRDQSTPSLSSEAAEGAAASDPASADSDDAPDQTPIPPAEEEEEEATVMEASLPTVEPASGDFTGYGWIVLEAPSEYDWLIYTQDANADLTCGVSTDGAGLKQKVLILASGIMKTRACCRACRDPSDVVVGTYTVMPGPTVTVKFLLAGAVSAADLDVDLTPLKDKFASLVHIDSRLITVTATARRNSPSAYVSMRIVRDSAEAAAELARQAQEIDVSELTEAAGGLIVSSLEISTFDPAVDVPSAPVGEDSGNVTVVTQSVEAAEPSDSCVNALTEAQYSALVRTCNLAHVCVDDVVRTTKWLSCDQSIYVTGLCAGVMLMLAIFVSSYTRFALAVLER